MTALKSSSSLGQSWSVSKTRNLIHNNSSITINDTQDLIIYVDVGIRLWKDLSIPSTMTTLHSEYPVLVCSSDGNSLSFRVFKSIWSLDRHDTVDSE